MARTTRKSAPASASSVQSMTAQLVDGDLPSTIADGMCAAGVIAVDTETSGLNWAADSLHMCQLYTDETGPVLLRRVRQFPQQLARVLGAADVTKVFHFAPFDLRFLEAGWGVRVVNIECTKTASKLLEPELLPADHSLQALLRRHLGVMIEKGPVRTSDWGAATLTDEQVAYAATDVIHLVALADHLRGRLQDANRADLFAQVCAYMPVDAHLEVSGFPNPLTY